MIDTRKVKIYVLKHPDTLEVRYVGKTVKRLCERIGNHITNAKSSRHNKHLSNWILQILSEGKRPIIELIEECEHSVWQEREKYWISQYPNLVNLTAGGDGCEGFHINEESREKWRQAVRGKMNHTEEFKKNMSKRLKGIPLTEEHKAHIGNANRGRKASLETKKKLSEAHKGIPQSEESRRKRSETIRAWWAKRKSALNNNNKSTQGYKNIQSTFNNLTNSITTMEKTFSKIEISVIKSTAKNVAPFVAKKAKVDEQIAATKEKIQKALEEKLQKLEAEKAGYQSIIDSMNQAVKQITGGYTTEDLVVITKEGTGQMGENGKEIMKTCYNLKYPETVVPPTTEGTAGSDFDIDAENECPNHEAAPEEMPEEIMQEQAEVAEEAENADPFGVVDGDPFNQ